MHADASTLHDESSRSTLTRRAALFWIAVFIVGVALNAGPMATTPEAHAPGFQWWIIGAVAAPLALGTTFELMVIVFLTRRFPVARERWLRNAAIHGLGALVLLTLLILRDRWMRGVSPVPLPTPRESVASMYGWGLLNYALTAAFVHAFVTAQHYRRAQVAGLRMRAELTETLRQRAEAELRALKAELNPHFLMEALHGVSRLMRSDLAAADRMLGQLGALLRSAVANATTQEVTLRDEMLAFEPFLEIERARLGAPVHVEWDIAADTLDALLPDMILRSLAENAVCRSLDDGFGARIRITARSTGSTPRQIDVRVSNDTVAAALESPAEVTPPATLDNARARLMELYGTEASLTVSRDADGGEITRLVLPWHDGEGTSVAAVAERAPTSIARPRASVWATWRQRVPVRSLAVAIIMTAALVAWREQSATPSRDTFPIQIALAFANCTILVGLSVLAFRLTRDYPLHTSAQFPQSDRRNVRVHATASLAVSVLGPAQSLGLAFATRGLNSHTFNLIRVVIIFVSYAAMFVLCYSFMVALAHGWIYARHLGSAKASGLRLQTQLSEAGRRRAESQLRALKTELNPHFVGNALNAVSSLMRTDLGAADRMLAQIGELLRTTFTRTGIQEVTLREELEQLEPFLAVERARLGHALEVRWNVDERALGGRVPHMILQPLLENAVKHGIAPRKGIGHIEVAARRGDGRLELLVRDDGVGLADMVASRGGSRPGGVGLSNTRARLTELYGGAASLELSQDTAGGAIARLSIPWREFDVTNAISA